MPLKVNEPDTPEPSGIPFAASGIGVVATLPGENPARNGVPVRSTAVWGSSAVACAAAGGSASEAMPRAPAPRTSVRRGSVRSISTLRPAHPLVELQPA
jgi:hypothetical protein